MEERIAGLLELADRLATRNAGFADLLRSTARRLEEGGRDEALADAIDILFEKLRSRAKLREGQLVAEAAMFMRRPDLAA